MSTRGLAWRRWSALAISLAAAGCATPVDTPESGIEEENVSEAVQAFVTAFPNGDFQSGSTSWTATGTAFNGWPHTNCNNSGACFDGKGISTLNNGESATGTLTGPTFTITQPYLCWQAGGWTSSYTAIDIGANGTEDIQVPLIDRDPWSEQCADLSAYVGQQARVILVDNDSGGGFAWAAWDNFRGVGSPPAGEPTCVSNPDFEEGPTAWTKTGTAFNFWPQSNCNNAGACAGGHGATTLPNGESATGTLTSAPFRVTDPYLCWLSGGYASSYTAIDIDANGSEDIVVPSRGVGQDSASGDNWGEQCADLGAHIGKMATVKLVDTDSGGTFAWAAWDRFQCSSSNRQSCVPNPGFQVAQGWTKSGTAFDGWPHSNCNNAGACVDGLGVSTLNNGESATGTLKSDVFRITGTNICWQNGGFATSYTAIDIDANGTEDIVVPARDSDGWGQQCADVTGHGGKLARVVLHDNDSNGGFAWGGWDSFKCATDCQSPLASCGGACVDTQSDKYHCGGCNTVCGGEQTCVDGECVGCGNGVVESGEQCDDGNTVDDDGCSNSCTLQNNCLNGFCEPIAECGSTTSFTEEGRIGKHAFHYDLGATSGAFALELDTPNDRSRFEVRYEDEVIYDSGCMSNVETPTISYSGTSSVVTVVVTGNCDGGTLADWEFTLSCPDSPFWLEQPKKVGVPTYASNGFEAGQSLSVVWHAPAGHGTNENIVLVPESGGAEIVSVDLPDTTSGTASFQIPSSTSAFSYKLGIVSDGSLQFIGLPRYIRVHEDLYSISDPPTTLNQGQSFTLVLHTDYPGGNYFNIGLFHPTHSTSVNGVDLNAQVGYCTPTTQDPLSCQVELTLPSNLVGGPFELRLFVGASASSGPGLGMALTGTPAAVSRQFTILPVGGGDACFPDETLCGGYCTHTEVDQYNCDGCGTTCSSGVCSDGTCVTCDPGETACGTSCKDLLTDAYNCGACGNLCPSGACTDGTCDPCGAGQSMCGGTCLDTRTDPSNCGACGNVCSSPNTCLNGVCGTAGTCSSNQQFSATGADGASEFHVDVGGTSGTLSFSYYSYTIPDQFSVIYEGATLFDSDCASTFGSTVSIPFSGSSSTVTIVVAGDCEALTGTAWDFALGCSGQ